MTIEVPEDIAQQFAADLSGLSRAATEALAIEGVRSGEIQHLVKAMQQPIQLLAPVALIVAIPGDFLTRGQIAPLSNTWNTTGKQHSWSNSQTPYGRTHAITAVRGDHLIVLHRKPRQPKSMRFLISLVRTEEGYSVSCPALPGCASQGETEQEALENIKDAIQDYLAVAKQDGAELYSELREVEIPG